MREYKTIFFWFGGVFTDSLPQLVFSTLLAGKERRNHVNTWREFRGLAEELGLGRITTTEFCDRSIDVAESSLDSGEMEKRLLKTACLREEVVAILGEVPTKYDCRLISDFPVDWYRKISTREGSHVLFPVDQVVYLPDLKIKRIVPDIFHALPASVGSTMTECLVVDAVSARAVEAVKSGLASIIYVYPERLKHEFALQQILTPENEVLHPHSSERVQI